MNAPELENILEAPERVSLDVIVLSGLVLDLVVRGRAGRRVDQGAGRVYVEEHLKKEAVKMRRKDKHG